jgi:hypothetical protein
MINIIGTAHSKTQFWSDAIRQGVSLDTCAAIVERFEAYLRDAAISRQAEVIAEENCKYLVDLRPGGLSVAANVAEELGLRHIYCDPDPNERSALNIQPECREAIWMHRLQPFSPNATSIIFVCGADHSLTFQSLLKRNGIHARIHCRDWATRRVGWMSGETDTAR